MKFIFKLSLLPFALLALVGCSNDEVGIEDFNFNAVGVNANGDIVPTTPPGTPMSIEAMLLIALVVIASLILITILVKNRKKK